ncbi:LemA family protein [Maribacter sp. LLG6340-A2]|uniref:LemA family protein n=1 Tax=Maribacter sp. LLG6340-A2 TaxID=3160834 RepID=UPI00386BADCC
MIYLKVIIQIIVGLSGLIALFLDYKWHDKRKKIFKTLRNLLIILSVLSLFIGVIITIKDDKAKDIEIGNLKNGLKDAQNTLYDIKSNGDTLKEQLKPFLELATKKYPNLKSSEALNKLSERLDNVDVEISNSKEKINNLSSQLNDERKTIKLFHAQVYIEFSGKWDGAPYPSWLQPNTATTYLNWKDKSGNLPTINFTANRVNFKTIDNQNAVFENKLSVEPGTAPLGELIDILKGYNELGFWFPFVDSERLLEQKILVNKVRITFYINGRKNGELYSESKTEIPLKKSSENTPGLTIEGNITELLKVKI